MTVPWTPCCALQTQSMGRDAINLKAGEMERVRFGVRIPEGLPPSFSVSDPARADTKYRGMVGRVRGCRAPNAGVWLGGYVDVGRPNTGVWLGGHVDVGHQIQGYGWAGTWMSGDQIQGYGWAGTWMSGTKYRGMVDYINLSLTCRLPQAFSGACGCAPRTRMAPPESWPRRTSTR
jgi:hypothetical protein